MTGAGRSAGGDLVRLRVSRWGLLYWDGPHLVWDDYLEQRRLPLSPGTEHVLRLFGDWQELAAVDRLTSAPDERQRWWRVVAQLRDARLLVAEGSDRDMRERRLLTGWEHWAPTARAFHFSTRLVGSVRFPPQQEQDATFQAKLAAAPPPPAFKRLSDTPVVPLPDAKLPEVSFAEVLYGRRSQRTFLRELVPLADLATLLQAAAAPAPDYRPDLRDRHQTTFKTSPSAGGRHPTDLYPLIRNVAGIEPGVYHYAAADHVLERVAGEIDTATVIRLCGDQSWVADAAVVLFYTSVFPRHQFRYEVTRGYRSLLLDVGHLSQTVYLLTTALGMRMTFTGMLREDAVEELLGLDLAEEFVVACAVIGAGSMSAVPDESDR